MLWTIEWTVIIMNLSFSLVPLLHVQFHMYSCYSVHFLGKFEESHTYELAEWMSHYSESSPNYINTLFNRIFSLPLSESTMKKCLL